MKDEVSNLWNPAEFAKAMADLEHDDPAQAPTFRRDQHLTREALFKGKVLALLWDEFDNAGPFVDLHKIIQRVEATEI